MGLQKPCLKNETSFGTLLSMGVSWFRYPDEPAVLAVEAVNFVLNRRTQCIEAAFRGQLQAVCVKLNNDP
jgi:hypothetical protein